jgi:branched-chain amino acid transport system substrate-binding protein
VAREILAKVHDKGQAPGPKEEVGQVIYMRGVVGAMLAVEGVRAAQERFGKGKVMTGEQARWGYENLNLTQAKLDALGFKGVMRPVSTSASTTWDRPGPACTHGMAPSSRGLPTGCRPTTS